MNPAARAVAFRLRGSDSDDERNRLRRELCLALGVRPEDIDPETGHDISRDAYDRVRTEWRDHIAMHGWTKYREVSLRKARAYWELRRPEWTRSDPWVTPGESTAP